VNFSGEQEEQFWQLVVLARFFNLSLLPLKVRGNKRAFFVKKIEWMRWGVLAWVKPTCSS